MYILFLLFKLSRNYLKLHTVYIVSFYFYYEKKNNCLFFSLYYIYLKNCIHSTNASKI